MDKKKKVLVVLSDILGNKFYGQRFREALNRLDGVEKSYLTLGAEDYQKYSAPALYRLSDTMHIAWITEKKYLEEYANVDFDVVLFATWEPMIGTYKYVKKTKIIVGFDLTPELSFKMVDVYDKLNNNFFFVRAIRSALKKIIFKPFYGKVFKSADYFLSWGGKWAKESVANDYGIDAGMVDILPRPVDTNFWIPSESLDADKNLKPILLFVGNDFKRKGGLFLLEIYKKELHPYCNLRIISNDECLKSVKIGNGVEICRGLTHDNIDEIKELYQTSDIFVFPTIRDAVPIVLAEAAATGLVILASDHLPGLQDIVKDNENGYLLTYGDRELWIEKIKNLVEDKGLLKQMSIRSRQIACEQLSIDRFNEKVILSTKRLLNE